MHEPYILCYSGTKFPFQSYTEDHIKIEDIAHALSNCCRFAGMSRRFYSVGQHSLVVAQLCPPEFRLAGLLHDATEAYMHDVTRPLKLSEFMYGYRLVEGILGRTIYSKFGVPYVAPPKVVKEADGTAYYMEKALLMPPVDTSDEVPVEEPTAIHEMSFYDQAVIEHAMEDLHPKYVEQWFLETFVDLARRQ